MIKKVYGVEWFRSEGKGHTTILVKNRLWSSLERAMKERQLAEAYVKSGILTKKKFEEVDVMLHESDISSLYLGKNAMDKFRAENHKKVNQFVEEQTGFKNYVESGYDFDDAFHNKKEKDWNEIIIVEHQVEEED